MPAASWNCSGPIFVSGVGRPLQVGATALRRNSDRGEETRYAGPPTSVIPARASDGALPVRCPPLHGRRTGYRHSRPSVPSRRAGGAPSQLLLGGGAESATSWPTPLVSNRAASTVR